MKGFAVYQTYEITEEKTTVQLYGRLENGQSFVAINHIEPYFFIKEKDQKAVEKYLSKYNIEKTTLTNFQGERVIKISSKIRGN